MMIINLPLPQRAPMRGITIFPFLIFVKRSKDTAAYQTIVHHEHVHVEQMKRNGWLSFVQSYFLNSSKRVRYEAEAYVRANLLPLSRRPEGLRYAGAVSELTTTIGGYFHWWMIARHPGLISIRDIILDEIGKVYYVTNSGYLVPRLPTE